MPGKPEKDGMLPNAVSKPLPGIIGVTGTSAPVGNRPSALPKSSSWSRLPKVSTLLTPSMAKILNEDKTIEVRGLTNPPAFDVGGKLGNIVTTSRVQTVHKGWRIVAIDDNRLDATRVSAALVGARQRPRYKVTFRVVDEDEEKASAAKAKREAEMQARQEALRKEGEARRVAKELEEAKRIAAEEAKRKAAEETELKAKEEAIRRAQEDEAKRAAAEEAIKKQQQEEAQKKQVAQLKEKRAVVEKQLETSTGLPPREDVADPQQAMLKALTQPKSAPKKKPNGPCDKCDGPHDTDDCPHFKKSRDDHKDAWDAYGSKGKGDNGSGQHIVNNARVIPQPGDGSCLFHSLAYGLGSRNATTLRADIADFIAANPDVSIADNPIKDWVLWDTGKDVVSYAQGMRTGSNWGGAVEVAVCAKLNKVDVHIYEKVAAGFARISKFEGISGQASSGKVVNLVYGGRVHYDALEL